MNLHLGDYQYACRRLFPSHVEPTDCFLYSICSFRLISIRASSRCFFFSSTSASWSLNFACCFLSISSRRFCAEEGELCDKVPSSEPNSLCPRFRSSTFPLCLREDESSGFTVLSLSCSLAMCSLRRRRLEGDSGSGEGRPRDGSLGWGGSTVSGSMTAEATVLGIVTSALQVIILRYHSLTLMSPPWRTSQSPD